MESGIKRNENPSAALFVPCIVDSLYPEVGEAAVRVLRRLGVRVEYPPDQTCCGQPAFNSGYLREARLSARRFIRIFEHAETVVCPSGSCAAMVKLHYPELFAEEPAWRGRAEELGQRVFEFSQYLVDVLGVEDLGARFEGKVTYHDSCHLLRSLGIAKQPRKLIAGVGGLEFTEMEDSDRCCGFGGAFSVKYPAISEAILEDKVDNILKTGADAVIGCDMGCLMNIEGMLKRKGLPVRAMHIASLLATFH